MFSILPRRRIVSFFQPLPTTLSIKNPQFPECAPGGLLFSKFWGTSPKSTPILLPRSHQCPHPARIASIQLMSQLHHRSRTANNHIAVRNAKRIGNHGSNEFAASRDQTQRALSGVTYHPFCVSKECRAP